MRIIPFVLVLVLILQPAAAASVTASYGFLKETAVPGEDNLLFLTVSNPSPFEVNGVTVEVGAVPGVTVGRSEISVGSLSPGSSQTVSLRVSASDYGIFYIPLRIKYYRAGYVSESLELTVPLTVSGDPVLSLSGTLSPEVGPGESANLSVTVFNAGPPAENLRVRINSTVFFPDTDSLFFGTVKTGERKSAEVRVTLSPDVRPGIYRIPVVLEYEDAAGLRKYREPRTISVRVSGETKLVLTAERSGRDLVLKVSNSGTQTARFLTLRVSGARAEPGEIYIGDLEPDDYDSERIKILEPPGTYRLVFNLSYSDPFGGSHSEIRAVTFEVPEEEKKEFPLWIPLLVLAALFLYLRRRR